MLIKMKLKRLILQEQWRSQKVGLGGAVPHFCLKSSCNYDIVDKVQKLHSIYSA